MSTNDLPIEARRELAEIARQYPNSMKGLCDFPGDIGRLAALCIECSEVV